MSRIFNFYAGPATLPETILTEAAKELVDFKDAGMSIMEASHRSKAYDDVHSQAILDIRNLYNVPDNFNILFLQGGASSQFFMIPMNLFGDGDAADYINTGAWTEKAIKEAQILGKNINIIASAKDTNFDRIPRDYKITNNAKYLYITSNNTIAGTQYHSFPETNGVPLVIDASSDIFSYQIDWKNIGILFAGAQKNAGPAGVTIVIIRKDLCETKNDSIPTMLRYSTHADKNSLFNTPPVFNIYMVGLNLKWLKSIGGIQAIQEQNQKKASMIYDVIDGSDGYYKGHAQKNSRSLMNITFNLKSPELETEFVAGSIKQNLIGLKGHRSVGGIRASIYNAMPVEGCEKLVDFMKNFMKNN
ncbi:MAG: phosphoserine transaminase [Spirochaetes bacterium]|nr:phosphoserine transaminase [Spirochaetota bacterium]